MKKHSVRIWSITFTVSLMFVLTVYLANADIRVVKRVHTHNKVIAITFDDGPSEYNTLDLLKILREKQVKATFFVVGKHIEKYPELFAQIVAAGHEIGSHGYSHRFLNKMSLDEAEQELLNTGKLIEQYTEAPRYLRPPGGGYNDYIVNMAEVHGYQIILWSVDPRDWRCPSVKYIVRNVVANSKPGRIILCHDGQYPLPTAKALAIFIDSLRAEGYTFVTISELLSTLKN